MGARGGRRHVFLLEVEDQTHHQGKTIDPGQSEQQHLHWFAEGGEHVILVRKISQEAPGITGQRLEHAKESRLVSHLHRQIQTGVQGDPNGGLQEHRQTTQHVQRVDALLTEQTGLFLLQTLWITGIPLLQRVHLRLDLGHASAEPLHVDLGAANNRVQQQTNRHDQEHNRHRPIAHEAVQCAEIRQQQTGQPLERTEGAESAHGIHHESVQLKALHRARFTQEGTVLGSSPNTE